MLLLVINLVISMLLVFIAFISVMMNIPVMLDIVIAFTFCYFIVFMIVKELSELLKK